MNGVFTKNFINLRMKLHPILRINLFYLLFTSVKVYLVIFLLSLFIEFPQIIVISLLIFIPIIPISYWVIDRIRQRETRKLSAYIYAQVQKHLLGLEDNPLVLEYITRHALVTREFLKTQTYERLDELILDYSLLVIRDEELQAKIKGGKAPAVLLPDSYYKQDGGGIQIDFPDSDDDREEVAID